MTFTKLLNEDNEIPIVTNGTNIFLHARGIGQSSLGPHAGYGNVFEKDFSEDVTEVSVSVVPLLCVCYVCLHCVDGVHTHSTAHSISLSLLSLLHKHTHTS